jgi:hypothetical protein
MCIREARICRVDFAVHAFLLLRLYIVCSGLRLTASRQGREMTPDPDFSVVHGLHVQPIA